MSSFRRFQNCTKKVRRGYRDTFPFATAAVALYLRRGSLALEYCGSFHRAYVYSTPAFPFLLSRLFRFALRLTWFSHKKQLYACQRLRRREGLRALRSWNTFLVWAVRTCSGNHNMTGARWVFLPFKDFVNFSPFVPLDLNCLQKNRLDTLLSSYDSFVPYLNNSWRRSVFNICNPFDIFVLIHHARPSLWMS